MSELTAWFYANHSAQVQNVFIQVLITNCHGTPKREFKKLLRRRRRQRRLKMNLYFTYESWDTLKSFTLFITLKIIMKLNLGHRV